MENIICARSSSDKSFSYIHKKNTAPLSISFEPHIHDSVEIYIFIKGSVDYIVEGNTYSLSPYDILVFNGNELHNAHILKNTDYERIVINIKHEFFTSFGITDYLKIFTDRKSGTSNLINGFSVKSSGIYSCLMRIEQYINETGKQNDMVVRSALIEFLHIINKIHTKSDNHTNKNIIISDILSYINKNLNSPLSLEATANAFFVSKYYLCRIFKQHTGLTFNKYVTAKRIALVRSLIKSGMTISEAASNAGFGNYSNFYRLYVGLTGKNPKDDLKGH